MIEIENNVKKLLRRAETLRDFKRYKESYESLNEANRLLEEAEASPVAKSSPDYMKEIFKWRAECYGIFGGVFRRQRKFAEASDMYGKGARYEQNGSYNLVNSIVMTILADPDSFSSKLIVIQNACSVVQQQIATGGRQREWWAWADLGLLKVLLGNSDGAVEAYRYYGQLGAKRANFQSTIDVLKSLQNALRRKNSKIASDITRILTYLEENTPAPD